MAQHLPSKLIKNFHQVVSLACHRFPGRCLHLQPKTVLDTFVSRFSVQIVRKILRHFPDEEILEFGLINKIWNSEARSLLQTRSTLFAQIGGRGEATSPTMACHDLPLFTGVISGMSTVSPFSGLKVLSYHNHPGSCGSTFDEDSAKLVNAKVPIKSLELNHLSYNPVRILRGEVEPGSCTTEYQPCKALEYFNSVLTSKAAGLQRVLLISSTDWPLPKLDMNEREQCEFPQLRSLEFIGPSYSEGFKSWFTLLRKIVCNAPNLHEVRFDFSASESPEGIHELVTFLVFMSAVMDGSKAQPVNGFFMSPLPMFPATKGFIARLAVRQLCIRLRKSNPSLLNGHFQQMKQIFRNSCKTLKWALVDSVLLLQILLDGSPFLELHELIAEINFDYLQTRYPALMGTLLRPELWKRCFPNLKKLEIRMHYDHPESHVMLMNELMQQLRRSTGIYTSLGMNSDFYW